MKLNEINLFLRIICVCNKSQCYPDAVFLGSILINGPTELFLKTKSDLNTFIN